MGRCSGRARAAFIWLRLAWLTHRLEGEEGGEGWIVEGTRSLSSAAGFGEENPFLTLISFSILLSSPLFFSLPSSLLIYVTDMMSSADDGARWASRCVGELGGGRHSIRRRRMLMLPDFQTNWGRRRRRQRKSRVVCMRQNEACYFILMGFFRRNATPMSDGAHIHLNEKELLQGRTGAPSVSRRHATPAKTHLILVPRFPHEYGA